MAKLGNFFLTLIGIQIALCLYLGIDSPATAMWDLITHPFKFSSTDWILSSLAIVATVGWVTAITVGQVFGFKTDFIIFAPAIPGLLSVLLIAEQLWTALEGKLYPLFCNTANVSITCPTVQWILWLTISPLIFYYAWTVLEWWRGKDV
jgi:hypothetical protein